MEDIVEYVSQSTKIDVLEQSLFKSRSEMGTAVKNKINPHFKNRYADLEALRDAADPVLEKYGLMVVNELSYSKDGSILYTNIVHAESGQWKNYSQMLIAPAKQNDPQAFGSYMTYAERYAYKLVTGINVSDRTDDDGERATRTEYKQNNSTENDEPLMSIAQRSDITVGLAELPNEGKSLEAWLLKKAEVTTLNAMPASKYNWVMSVIAKAKERDGNSEKN